MTDSSRASLLGIAPGDTVWVLGHSDEENALLDPVASGVEVIDETDRVGDLEADDEDGERDVDDEELEPDAAIVVIDDAISAPDDLDEALPRVTGIDLVWIAVPRRSRGVDPAEVEVIVADYGWVASDRVDLDDTWTAVRVELA